MQWFKSFIKAMWKRNKKHMAQLGKDGRVYLLAYPDPEIGIDGLATTGAYEKSEIRAVIIPFASQGFGRRFAEQLMREVPGESYEGYNYLILDEKWLKDNNIAINTELDKIEWDDMQFKFTRKASFQHYFHVVIYLVERIARTYEE